MCVSLVLFLAIRRADESDSTSDLTTGLMRCSRLSYKTGTRKPSKDDIFWQGVDKRERVR